MLGILRRIQQSDTHKEILRYVSEHAPDQVNNYLNRGETFVAILTVKSYFELNLLSQNVQPNCRSFSCTACERKVQLKLFKMLNVNTPECAFAEASCN